MSGRTTASDLIDSFVDSGSWVSWDVPLDDPPGMSGRYRSERDAARAATGLDESVLTGEGLLQGRRVAVGAVEFGFLGGSLGVAAATRLESAVRRATQEGLPLLAAPASGGTRMQEGTVAFVQMLRITEAIREHRAAGLPYLVYLRHPTTGGVLASWGSLGHLTVAEPGALIGFLGPRVFRALHGEDFPSGVQVAENLYARGIVDAVLPVDGLPDIAARALHVLCDPPVAGVPVDVDDEDADGDAPAWECVTRSRDPHRPGVRDLLREAASDLVVLRGTQEGEAGEGMLLALASFGGQPCVVVGQDRKDQRRVGPLGPAALRSARRGMRLADELHLPLVTVIDTPGAALTREAEEGGLAGEIARSLYDLLGLSAPTLSLILGAGAGGGALALLPADRVLCAQHGWLSPLPPEGASVILHGTIDLAPQIAAEQGVRAADLLAAGIVDRVVPERPDASQEPSAFVRRVGAIVAAELAELRELDPRARLRDRAARLDGLALAGARGFDEGDSS